METKIMNEEDTGKQMVKKLRAYCCSECDERFYLEYVLNPNSINCPICGGPVDINSGDYKKMIMWEM